MSLNPEKTKKNMTLASKRLSPCFMTKIPSLSMTPDHSEDEDRFLILGISASLLVLVVCQCYRDEEKIIRLISARKADRSESKTYNRG